MTFGVTSSGFVLKTLRDILSETNGDMVADISSELDVSPMSPDGLRNAVHARQEALLWELFALIVGALDPDKAEDDLLISLCKLTGTVPRGARATTIAETCVLVAGTTLTPGIAFVNVAGQPNVRATPIAAFTAPSSGSFVVQFALEQTGPIPIAAGTLTTIAPSIVGWTSATNALDGTLGRNADDNESLRLLRQQELAAAGSSTLAGIKSDLLQVLDPSGAQLITDAHVYENTTDFPDAQGRPRKSVECLIIAPGGSTADEIAQAVFDAVGAGPTIFGNGSGAGTATDVNGLAHTVPYSIPSLIPVWIIYTLHSDSTYAGDAAFALAVASVLNTGQVLGADAKVWDCEVAARQPGVLNLNLVAGVKIGFAPAPTLSVDLGAADVRSLFTFDSARISVVHI